MGLRAGLLHTVSVGAVTAGLKASAEAVASTVRRSAIERVSSMAANVDLSVIARLDGDAAREAADIIRADIMGQAAWWRDQLIEQGYSAEQVERLVADYRKAALRELRDRFAAARMVEIEANEA